MVLVVPLDPFPELLVEFFQCRRGVLGNEPILHESEESFDPSFSLRLVGFMRD